MSEYRITANQGRTVLNPRHVTRLVITDEEKQGSPTGERVYRVMAYQSDGNAFVLDAPSLPRERRVVGWMSKESAGIILERAGDLITASR